MPTQDQTKALISAVNEARNTNTPLVIQGGDTKHFYGRRVEGRPLEIGAHQGIIHYEPSELVITARAGTPLDELERLLHKHQQIFSFEPPHFGTRTTLGGCVAAGLSGPRRPWGGAVRDNVLGAALINGKGERLHFGGEVMKNVAGYDLARTMVGSLGTLAVLLEVSVKVSPRPAREMTYALSIDAASAIQHMNTWAARPLPISATWHDGKDLYVRLSGTEQGVQAAAKTIAGDPLDWSEMFWRNIREQGETFFVDDTPLWRLSVPPATPPLKLPGKTAMEWNGGLRWLKSDAPAPTIREQTQRAGGHATLFRNGDRAGEVFHPLPPPLLGLHKNIKKALDPLGIFNPGRMYKNL
ncbi:MAG: glycolate oxidase subunit GlcE [Gammaproteobacteria bacterium]|nr:glycolate oxidase subunit GlcE [Gammaproteobacteria bacterium]